MSPIWIPIIGTIAGCSFVVAIVALVHHNKVQEARMRVETELQQMEMAYQRACQSLSR